MGGVGQSWPTFLFRPHNLINHYPIHKLTGFGKYYSTRHHVAEGVFTMNQSIHFIGIGGTGMGPLAKIFLEMGWSVSGSDLSQSETTIYLERLGADIKIGHAATNINGAINVVYSSAIPKDNPEYLAAKSAELNLLHRSEVVALLLNQKQGIAVAGAHGKTTITSMIAWVLDQAGYDPLVLIGARFTPFGPGAKFGKGNLVVAEADESDRSFLRYHPQIGIVTSIEADHLENYDGDYNMLVNSYRQFLSNLKPGGIAVLGVDDLGVRQVLPDFPEAITYGFGHGAQYLGEITNVSAEQTDFTVYHKNEKLGDFQLNVPGEHNVANALAAIAVCDWIGVDVTDMLTHLTTFSGAQRRFEMICEKQGIKVVDDYAHHPTEIVATLNAARQGWQERRIIAVFQPHRYSRTHFLFKEFTQCFTDADIVVLTDIYAPPPEEPIAGVSSQRLAEDIKSLDKEVYLVNDHKNLSKFLVELVKENDFVITMGAGSIWQTAHELCDLLD